VLGGLILPALMQEFSHNVPLSFHFFWCMDRVTIDTHNSGLYYFSIQC